MLSTASVRGGSVNNYFLQNSPTHRKCSRFSLDHVPHVPEALAIFLCRFAPHIPQSSTNSFVDFPDAPWEEPASFLPTSPTRRSRRRIFCRFSPRVTGVKKIFFCEFHPRAVGPPLVSVSANLTLKTRPMCSITDSAKVNFFEVKFFFKTKCHCLAHPRLVSISLYIFPPSLTPVCWVKARCSAEGGGWVGWCAEADRLVEVGTLGSGLKLSVGLKLGVRLGGYRQSNQAVEILRKHT